MWFYLFPHKAGNSIQSQGVVIDVERCDIPTVLLKIFI